MDDHDKEREQFTERRKDKRASLDDYDKEREQFTERRKASQQILNEASADDRQGQLLLNTFMGVFVPTTQNILGIILFIRLPFITAQAGIFEASTIVFMACLSSTLTSLSMSGIATNGKVTAGGCYQIIKKSLGNEFGGVVGILLFLSNNFGVAMYVLGFVEALQFAFPGASFFGDDENGEPKDKLNDYRILGFFTLTFLFSIVYVGISYISKFALMFLSGVMLAIFSIFLGVFVKTGFPDPDKGIVGLSRDNFVANWGSEYREYEGEEYSYAILLALFFPAVTDPLAGSNLSGDLQDAAKSIPPGTLYAVMFTSLIFLSQVILTGACVNREDLLTNSLIVTDVGWPLPHIIFAGIMLSTLGAGLQSLAGAPRLLSAIASDDLLPILRPFVPAHGQEPRRIVIMCYCLSMCVLMIGKLNGVAPFITMWFLTCYAIINGACFILAFDSSPGFRPTWKYFHWSTSLAGCIICLGMMFFIYWQFALGALVFALFLYKYMQRQSYLKLVEAEKAVEEHEEGGAEISDEQRSRADWASTLRFTNCRKALLALKDHDVEFKYWRPFILFLCKIDEVDGHYVPQRGMINLISQLMKRGKGMSFVAGVVKGTYTRKTADLAKLSTQQLTKTLKEKGVEGFAEVVVASTIAEGQRFLIQGKGFGVLRPNTVMMGFPTELEAMSDQGKRDYVSVWKDVAVSGKTLMVCKGTVGFPTGEESLNGYVDVWWVFDILPARGLLILIPYLLQQSKVWKGTRMRLFVVTDYEEKQTELQVTLEAMLKAAGIKALVHVLQMDAKDAPRYTHMSHQNPLVELVPSETPSLLNLNPQLSGVGMDGEAEAPMLATEQENSQRDTNYQEDTEDEPVAPMMNPMMSESPSISKLTDYLAKVSLNMEPLSPRVSYVPGSNAEPPLEEGSVVFHDQEDIHNKEANFSHTAPADKKGSRVERRESKDFLDSDKYGSRLTAAFKRYSSNSALVVIALPKMSRKQSAEEYLDSLNILIQDLHRVIMVQESGKEKVQLYG